MLRNFLTDLNPTDAIATGIQQWGENANSHQSGDDRDNTACNAALGWQTNLIRPLTGIVVHTAGIHDAENIFNVSLLDGAFACNRVDAAIGQGGGNFCQITGAD